MQVELAQFLTIIEDESVLIIDARPSAAFMLGYVPNAIQSTPFTAKYAIAMDIIRKDSPLVFILDQSIAAETLAYFTKAEFTGIKGSLVSIEDTIKGFKRILSGELDHLPEAAFNLKGSIEEVIEAGEKMMAEA